MTIAIISHPDCVLHHAGEMHPESPRRVEVINDAISRFHFKLPVLSYEAPVVTREQLLRVHPKHYIEWLESIAPKEDYVGIDEDTYMNKDTLRAAFLAAGSVTFAVDLVMSGDAKAVFCNVRPPGHHAERERAMGFCIFNNVAVGVMHAMEAHGLSRIAIIDFDVHHGNGTQQIFQENQNVMLCSSFEHPLYPGYEPELDNPHIINLPLPAGTNGEDYRARTAAAWFDKLHEFKPQLVFFSAGFDAHVKDPLGNIELTDADYVWLTTQIREIAEKYSDGKIVSVLEGGYNLDALAHCVPAHINALVKSA
ncbi:MAG TPA: histone deacetylase family protein [Gammaproteobacteria bacterium]|nr:histone deacetylase family protein [Gammaproteobacteria bacterium]